MKKIFSISLLSLLFIAAPFISQAQDMKVAWTNVELVMAFMPEARNAEKVLTTYGEKLQAALQLKGEAYQAKEAEIMQIAQSEAGFSSEAQKNQMIGELEKLQEAYIKEQANSEDKLMVKQQQLMEPIITKIQTAIDEIATEGGYDYILNATSGNNIVFGMETMDITEDLARKLGIEVKE